MRVRSNYWLANMRDRQTCSIPHMKFLHSLVFCCKVEIAQIIGNMVGSSWIRIPVWLLSKICREGRHRRRVHGHIPIIVDLIWIGVIWAVELSSSIELSVKSVVAPICSVSISIANLTLRLIVREIAFATSASKATSISTSASSISKVRTLISSSSVALELSWISSLWLWLS